MAEFTTNVKGAIAEAAITLAAARLDVPVYRPVSSTLVRTWSSKSAPACCASR
jgi:hypothetical protein